MKIKPCHTEMLASDGAWYDDIHALTRRPHEFWPGLEQSPAERLNSVVRLAAYVTLGVSLYRRDARYFMVALVFIAVASVAFRHHDRQHIEWRIPFDKKRRPAASPSKSPSASRSKSPSAPPYPSPEGSPAHMTHTPFSTPQISNHPIARMPPSSFLRPDHQSCTLSTPDNPFANMLIGDLANNPGRPPACKYDVHKDQIRENFNRGLVRNGYDLYEKENSQRQFMTMPVTTSAPDTIAFAHFCYGNAGRPTCKEDPSRCTGNFP